MSKAYIWSVVIFFATIGLFILCALTLAGAPAPVRAVTDIRLADSDLDPTFGVGGVVTLSLPQAQQAPYVYALATWDDRTQVSFGGADGSVYAVRFKGDGGIDTAFGSAGVITLAVPLTGAKQVQMGLDGKFLVLVDGALYRLNQDGTRDLAFANQGRLQLASSYSPTLGADIQVVTAEPSNTYLLSVSEVMTPGTGFPLPGGGPHRRLRITRANDTGQLLPTPNIYRDVSLFDARYIEGVFALNNGHFLVFDYLSFSFPATAISYEVVDAMGQEIKVGSIDSWPNFPSFTRIRMQNNDQAVFSWTRTGGPGNLWLGNLGRLTADGEYDASFNASGQVTDTVLALDHVTQSDGKLVTVGPQIARYTVAGQRDDGFAPGGAITPTVTISTGPGLTSTLSVTLTSIALQLDGKIIVAGWYESEGVERLILVRYMGTPVVIRRTYLPNIHR